MFLLNKTLLAKWISIEGGFSEMLKKKKTYCMVKWDRVCSSKNKGGLGVKDVRKQNIRLLCKWWWKLENHDGLWQRIVKQKYMRNKTVPSLKGRSSDSPCLESPFECKRNLFER
jgi:hypothetical protein